MGLRWNRETKAETTTGETQLRVLTYNTEWGHRGAAAIAGEVMAARPDLALLQDTNNQLRDDLRSLLQLTHFRDVGQYIVASQWPILEAEELLLPGDDGRYPPSYLRCRLKIGSQPVVVYNVHLLTPRDGLAAIWHGDADGISRFQQNTQTRLDQAGFLASALQKETAPVLLAGDLNVPEQAIACRMLLRTGLSDSFSAAGRGYGYTYGHSTRFRHSFLRIDHILFSRHFRASRCQVGGGEGSDHRPVIADLTLEKAGT
jgi:endonuclease/exonuclease/phosphatase (EEP) superfamily protein YafD